MFHKASKTAARLRLAIYGPSGAGKTFTALTVATGLAPGKVAVIDTERGSASKYADQFGFDVLNLDPPYHPERFVQAVDAAEAAGYQAIVIDSLSHAWNGPGGILEIVDEESRKMKGNSYVAWAKGTPLQNRLIDSMTRCRMHLIATMRAKTEYVVETDSRGKSAPRKVGMAPVQRDGMEYEFDLALDMTTDNDAIVAKTRCPELAGRVLNKPGADLVEVLRRWLDGAPAPAEEAPAKVQPRVPAPKEDGHERGAQAVASMAAVLFQSGPDLVQWLLENRPEGSPWVEVDEDGYYLDRSSVEGLRAVYSALMARKRAQS